MAGPASGIKYVISSHVASHKRCKPATLPLVSVSSSAELTSSAGGFSGERMGGCCGGDEVIKGLVKSSLESMIGTRNEKEIVKRRKQRGFYVGIGHCV